MRRNLLLIAPLVLLGCSRPAAQTTGDTAAASAPVAATAATDTRTGPDPAAVQASEMPVLSAVADGAEPPSTMLNRYVAALLNRDRAASDAAWTIPPSDPRHADDAALRQLQDLRTLRLHSDPRSPATIGSHRSCLKCRCRSARSPPTVRSASVAGTACNPAAMAAPGRSSRRNCVRCWTEPLQPHARAIQPARLLFDPSIPCHRSPPCACVP